MTENEKTLLATITRLETENTTLRQQVDALSRALAADTDEYRDLRIAVEDYSAPVIADAGYDTNLMLLVRNGRVLQMATRFITATEAAKANAGAGSGDGEAG